MAVAPALAGGSVEQGLLAGGEAVLLVSVEQGLMRCVTAELCKTGKAPTHHSPRAPRGGKPSCSSHLRICSDW